MAGLCGRIGADQHDIDTMLGALCVFGGEETSISRGPTVHIGYSDHAQQFEQQPVSLDDDTRLWIWGTVTGHCSGESYQPISDEANPTLCERLFDRHGLDFFSLLNGSFIAIVEDLTEERVTFITDRLSSRPIYLTQGDNGATVFSSLLPSLHSYPSTKFEPSDTLGTIYLTFGRTFGTTTPFSNVHQLPPASMVTFDSSGAQIDEQRYWWPIPRPDDTPFQERVDRFSQLFDTVMSQRRDESMRQGLLLSGGTDSRLIADCLGHNVTAFHMNEFLEENIEARTARRIAETVDAEFVFLERSLDYYPTVFELAKSLNNFNGRFEHMHTLGFAEDIRARVDEIYTGQFADSMLTSFYVPPRRRKLSFLHKIPQLQTPIEVTDKGDFLGQLGYPPICGWQDYDRHIQLNTSVERIITSEITIDDDGISFFGVTYPDWDALSEFGMLYPLTNTFSFSFYESLYHLLPVQAPFLDYRLIDLSLTMPVTHRWRDVIAGAVKRRNPSLARIPHPSSGVPLDYPKSVHSILSDFRKAKSLLKSSLRVGSNASDLAYLNQGKPWPNFDELIRRHSFVQNELARHDALLKELEWIDEEAVTELYQQHLQGGRYWTELFALITLLSGYEMSVKQDNSLSSS